MRDTADPTQAIPDRLHEALLESRQRWREFGTIATDFVFEIGLDGCLTFVSPEVVLGWPAADLLGTAVANLLAERDAGVPDPFRFVTGIRRRRTWVRRADGEQVCLSISLAPLLNGAGSCIGARGIGIDVTAREQEEMKAAAALRRAEVLDHILGQMRQEVLAPRMMVAALEALLRALGGRGAAVLDLAHTAETASVLHQAGQAVEPVLPEVLVAMREQSGPSKACRLAGGLQLLTCQLSTRFGHQAALAIWREAAGRSWEADDVLLLTSATGVVRIVLEHEAIQRELARQARTDPLTGLLNRRAFLDETSRRIDRLDREGLPGTLIFIDLDRLKPLNDRLGHEAGDAALIQTGSLLRNSVRPSDLVARLGGDEFALWLDGSDELTAAERAEGLRLNFPQEMAHFSEGEELGMTMSIGIACRQPTSHEELDHLIQRADRAMYEVKRNGRGHWRVSHPESVA